MKRKPFLIASLIVIITVCLSFTAYAEGSDLEPYASELIGRYSLKITPSGTTISATAAITANATSDQIGFSSLKFQRYSSGSWITVKTISAVYKYDAASYGGTYKYTGESGEKYRAVCTFYVRNGTTSQTRTSTTSSVTL